jgi:hypothetical protein
MPHICAMVGMRIENLGKETSRAAIGETAATMTEPSSRPTAATAVTIGRTISYGATGVYSLSTLLVTANRAPAGLRPLR